MAKTKATVAMFTEIEWRVYHAMQDIDRGGLYPTWSRCCKALPDVSPGTINQIRWRLLSWDVLRLATPPEKDAEPYAAANVTDAEKAEVDASRIEVLADSILEMLEGRKSRKDACHGGSDGTDLDIIELMISESVDQLPLASAVRTILNLWDANFTNMRASA